MSSPVSVDDWLKTLSSEVAQLAEYVRSVIHKTVPDVIEEIRWERPCFLKDGLVCFMTAKESHVNLGFFRGNELWDVDAILEGESKNLRYVKIRDRTQIHEPSVVELIQEAAGLNATRPHARWK